MSVYRRTDGVFAFDFQLRGVRFCGSTGVKSERAAKDIERQKRQQARQRLALAREQRTAPMTINVAFDRFWSEVGDHYSGSYRQTVWGALRWLTAELGASTLIREIGPNIITQAIASRRTEGVSNSTVNRTVTELLRTVLRRAGRLWEQETQSIEWHKLMLAEPRERVRELRDHEEAQLTQDMRADYLPAIRFLLISGLRKKELVTLKWSAIDWRARIITIRGKGDKVANIPLTDAMRAILSPLRDHHPEFVFTYQATRTKRINGKPHRVKFKRYPITYSGLGSTWRRYAGDLDDFRFHDLRHTAATRLLRKTGNLRLAQKLLRHENISATSRYAHVTDDDLRAGMDAVASDTPAVAPATTGAKRASGAD